MNRLKNLSLDCTLLKVLTASWECFLQSIFKKEHRCLCCQRTILSEINRTDLHLNFNCIRSFLKLKMFCWSWEFYCSVWVWIASPTKKTKHDRSSRIVELMMSQNIIFRRRTASFALYGVQTIGSEIQFAFMVPVAL